MKNNFTAHVENGGLKFESDRQRTEFKNFLKEHEGARLKFEMIVPESPRQRAFYHGAVIPLWAYLDGKDYRDADVLEYMHEIAKREFNGDIVVVNGKTEKIGKSSKGLLKDGYLERVIDYLAENYGIDPSVVLNPELYKRFRDTVYPYESYDTFIDYLVDLKILK